MGVYDPADGHWREWRLPGAAPGLRGLRRRDGRVWLSDFGANALVRFDPPTETFRCFPSATPSNVRQILGRPGEVWGAESAADSLVVVRGI